MAQSLQNTGTVTTELAASSGEGIAQARRALDIPSLDGLRALSFGLVFVAHAGAEHVVPGGFGVTVFFFLSGYLITTLLRVELERTGRISLSKFYLRRAIRILPPFYLVLLLSVAATRAGLLPPVMTPEGVRAQALHYANYWLIANGSFDGVPRGTGVYWSLAVEEHFYVLFPGLYLLVARTKREPRWQALVLLAMCALVLAWRIVLVEAIGVPKDRTGLASDTRFDSLLFGCALALYGNPALDASRIAPRIWKHGLFPAAIVALLVSFLVRDPRFRETLRYTLQGVALIPIFVCAIRYPDWLPMRPLNWRPLAYIGVLSYSLYLAHQVVIYLLTPFFLERLGPWAFGGLTLLGTLCFSWLLYQLVEKPCAKLRKQMRT